MCMCAHTWVFNDNEFSANLRIAESSTMHAYLKETAQEDHETGDSVRTSREKTMQRKPREKIVQLETEQLVVVREADGGKLGPAGRDLRTEGRDEAIASPVHGSDAEQAPDNVSRPGQASAGRVALPEWLPRTGPASSCRTKQGRTNLRNLGALGFRAEQVRNDSGNYCYQSSKFTGDKEFQVAKGFNHRDEIGQVTVMERLKDRVRTRKTGERGEDWNAQLAEEPLEII
uniref:Uncharacterized protein n=1 Tax=Rangifer tarandus platyrhynchus TaxID=3082113 RepID=A0ACB0F551_RANTA|nr:unnamed protein product [Rangifer tarandus platyrhynchus]